MPGFISDSPLARDLIRIGDEAIAREDDAALRAYFAEGYVLHGPGGDLGFDELKCSPRCVPLSKRSATRPRALHRRRQLPCRTTFSGDFTGVFTYSPIGPVEPTGQHLEWEVLGTFRHDDQRAACRGVGADRLPQLPDQARRHHDGARPAGKVIAVLTSPGRWTPGHQQTRTATAPDHCRPVIAIAASLMPSQYGLAEFVSGWWRPTTGVGGVFISVAGPRPPQDAPRAR